MDIPNSSVVFILPRTGFKDTVFNDISRVFMNHEARVTVASVNGDAVRSTRNITVLPDTGVTDIDIDKTDAVILVACPDAVPGLEHEPVYNLLRAAHEKKVVIGAVCAAPLVLAKLSLLEDKTVSGHDAVEHESGEYGFSVGEEAVTVDNGFVTARESGAERFAEEIVDVLRQQEGET